MRGVGIFKLLFFSIGLQILQVASSYAQSNFKLGAYGEFYYGSQLSGKALNSKANYVYSHHRMQELALNLALVKASYADSHLRANLGLGTGSYMQANYAAESAVFRHVYEANMGVRLSQKADLWLDVGVLPSHIGFESAVGADNATLTRSVLADNSPFYETGARLAFNSKEGEWYLALLLLNGWQHIQQTEGNTKPAFGHQVTWKPNTGITLNSSSFIGNDKPDSLSRMRYFHNLYAQFTLNDRWQGTAAFDIGAEQDAKGSKRYNIWYSPILIMRYQAMDKLGLAGRLEYYADKEHVLIAEDNGPEFATWGYSVNVDYNLLPQVKWRLELRRLQVQDGMQLTTALTASF